MGAYSDYQDAVNGVGNFVVKTPEEVATGLRFTLQSINPQSNIYRQGTLQAGGTAVSTSHMYKHTLTDDPGGLGGNPGPITWESYIPQVHYIISVISESTGLIPDRLSFQIKQHDEARPNFNPQTVDEGPISAEQCKFINVGFSKRGTAGGEFVQISTLFDNSDLNPFYHTYEHPDPDFVVNRLSWEKLAMYALSATNEAHDYTFGGQQSPIRNFHNPNQETAPTYSVRLPDNTTGGINNLDVFTGFNNDDALTNRIFVTTEKLVIGTGCEHHLHENHQQALVHFDVPKCDTGSSYQWTNQNFNDGPYGHFYDRFGWQDLYITYDLYGDGSVIHCAVVPGIVNPQNMIYDQTQSGGNVGQHGYSTLLSGLRHGNQSALVHCTYRDPFIIGGTTHNPIAGADYEVTEMHSLGTLLYKEDCECTLGGGVPYEFEMCKAVGGDWECKSENFYGIAMSHGEDSYVWSVNGGPVSGMGSGGWNPVDHVDDPWLSISIMAMFFPIIFHPLQLSF